MFVHPQVVYHVIHTHIYIHMHNLLRDQQTDELLHTHKYIWAPSVMGSKQQSALVYNDFQNLPIYRSHISENWIQ